MTSDSEADAPRPRVLLALPADHALRQRLLTALKGQNVDVVGDGPAEDADVVVLRRAELRGDLADLLEDDAAPGVVVVSEDPDATERVELLAKGASQVLDSARADEELAEVLEAVAEVESAGGSRGPEIRGHEATPRLFDFLSRAPAMQRFVAMASRVAEADANLLITGETGVGKERLARAIHAESGRAAGPFVAVNCGAMPEQLLESQLFGHEKGAFTGADKLHRGFFEQAAGGSLFLDEVGEMPAHLQVKLLTVLQRHEVQRLGAENPVQIDARVMAATNQDLQQQVQAGEFREDLFYRLNVIHLEIPSLRERREDIADLVGGLMQFFREDIKNCKVERIDEQAMQALLAHAWPGNVRELINVVERAMLLCTGTEIGLGDLPDSVSRGEGPAPENPVAAGDWQDRSLKEVREAAIEAAERGYLDAVLRHCQGRIKDAARQAGIGTRALYDRMRRYGLRKEDYKSS